MLSSPLGSAVLLLVVASLDVDALVLLPANCQAGMEALPAKGMGDGDDGRHGHGDEEGGGDAVEREDRAASFRRWTWNMAADVPMGGDEMPMSRSTGDRGKNT